jgi:hypothetical protein
MSIYKNLNNSLNIKQHDIFEEFFGIDFVHVSLAIFLRKKHVFATQKKLMDDMAAIHRTNSGWREMPYLSFLNVLGIMATKGPLSPFKKEDSSESPC